jgi:hypothetical protein
MVQTFLVEGHDKNDRTNAVAVAASCAQLRIFLGNLIVTQLVKVITAFT